MYRYLTISLHNTRRHPIPLFLWSHEEHLLVLFVVHRLSCLLTSASILGICPSLFISPRLCLCCCHARSSSCLPQLSHTRTHTLMYIRTHACSPPPSCLMFHPHTVAVKAKRASSIKQRTDSPAACHGSNCGFITDRANQYGTLDSAPRRMI